MTYLDTKRHDVYNLLSCDSRERRDEYVCVCVHVCLCVCMYTCVHGDTEKKSKPEKENYGKMLTFDETGQGY